MHPEAKIFLLDGTQPSLRWIFAHKQGMKNNSAPQIGAVKSLRMTIRISPDQDEAIRSRAASRKLNLTKFILSQTCGDGASNNCISRAEWRQVAIACEAHGQLLVLALAHAHAMPDQVSGELLRDIAANSGRNQARLESLLDRIEAAFTKDEEDSDK